MNTKFLLALLLALIFSAKLFAQNVVVSVIINGKKVGQQTITENPAAINVEKKKYKKLAGLTVMVKQKINKIYKRTLQITDENESLLFSINEQKIKPGLYKINLASMRQQLLQHDIIKVYLAEEPANEMMRIPSKRQLLAELHLR